MLFEQEFDIIVLSEIWSTNICYFDNIFSSYTFFYSAPNFQKAGGIGVLIHRTISYSVVDSTNSLNYFNNLAEYITIDVIRNNLKYRFYLFYRHPSSVVSNFMDILLRYLALHKLKNRSFIIGDLNIDLQKYDSNNCVQRYLNELINLNFAPYSLLPTRCNDCSAI